MRAAALVALVGAGLVAACTPARPASSPSPARPMASAVPVASPPATSASAVAGAGTAERVAAAGKVVYQQQCQSCHGDQGQGVIGPALIGSRASPAKYGPTAADWYAYIRSNMPQTAPGSLTPEEYVQVTAYLLLQNGLVQPSQPVDEAAFQQIKTAR